MKNYQKAHNLGIVPLIYLQKQSELGLSDSELVAMLKLCTLSDESTEFSRFLTDVNITQEDLMALKNKQLIDIIKVNGKLKVEMKPVQEEVEQISETSPIMLNREAVDRINFLLNRKLQMYELEKINRWLSLDYTIEQVELAISKSMINDVDNFNYIEKVLFNNEKKNQQNLNIERNFDLY